MTSYHLLADTRTAHNTVRELLDSCRFSPDIELGVKRLLLDLAIEIQRIEDEGTAMAAD